MELDNATKSHILQLQAAARQNRLVIFVGAGVSASASVPVWKELVEMFQNELPENVYDDKDVLKTAQLYRELRGDVEYFKQVKKILKYGQASCNQIHEVIMQLNPCHIITTNYDDLLEQAALLHNKQYYVVAKDSHLPANQGEKMIIKMHGDFKENNIVLTENDYFDYSRNFPLIRSFLLSLFSTKVVLFVGFSFNDINLKYILREVSSVLDSQMQRVYLLMDNDQSSLAYSYFEKKGIQLLHIPSNVSKEILKKQKIKYSNEGLSGERSQSMNQSLNLINYYDQQQDDPIEMAIDFLQRYDGQIRFWGKYLKNLFPENKRGGFEISQCDLTLPSDYKSWFKENIANDDVFKHINEKYGANIEWLLKTLHTNRISSINGHQVIAKERLKAFDKEQEHCSLNLVYSLAITDIEKRIVELSYRPHSYTIDDLELPYLFFKIGKYKEAYQIYKNLSTEFWQRRKYVLYFISLYNIKVISGRVLNEDMTKRGFDFEKFHAEISAIKLTEVLEDLPLDMWLRELLESIVNGNMVMTAWVEAARLNQELQKQRKNAELGGMSINNNIIKLLDIFTQTFYFCNENYILSECLKQEQEAYAMMAQGILNSVMTPDDDEKWQTKLDGLMESNLLLFVFMVTPEVLKNSFKDIVKSRIPVTQEFRDTLRIYVANLVEDVSKPSFHEDLLDPMIASNYLKNIIMLLNRIDDAPILNDVYKLIIHYWYKGMFINFGNELLSLCARQEPTAEEAIQMIDNALHSPTLKYSSDIDNLIAQYATIANNGGVCLQDVPSIDDLAEIKNIVLRSTFLLALPEEVRLKFVDHLRASARDMYELCLMEYRTGAHIITNDTIERLKGKILDKKSNLDHYSEALACTIMKDLTLKEEYAEIKEALLSFQDNNECFRFMLDPIHFKDVSKIHAAWLIYVDDDDLVVLLQNDEIRKMIGDFYKKEPWNIHFKERIWDVQFRNTKK